MRCKFFIPWAGVRWLLLMFLIAPNLQGPPPPAGQAIEPIRIWKGLASWYGPGFDGRTTANGETYDMYASTAAHLTLPMGSLVRVVNPATGQGRVVRINDRGPFIEGREIDVSYDVARWLGLHNRGVARVRMELLEVPKHPWPQTRAAN